MLNKVYLGDSVYADKDEESRLILTTENGISTTNLIVLEPEALRALNEYLNGER